MPSLFSIFVKSQPGSALAIAIALFLTACTTPWQGFQAGQEEAAVIAKLGRPREVYSLPDGGKRLMWPTQPLGEITTAADIDANGKVISVRQVLTEQEFAQVQIGHWSKHDVLIHFGQPVEIAFFPRIKREVWSYRYQENNIWYMLYHFYFDQNGVLRSTQKTPDPLRDPDHRSSFRF